MRALSAAAAPRGSRKARRIHKALAVHGRHLGPVSHGQGAVSYTHLDVYKRQTADRAKFYGLIQFKHDMHMRRF